MLSEATAGSGVVNPSLSAQSSEFTALFFIYKLCNFAGLINKSGERDSSVGGVSGDLSSVTYQLR